MIIRLLVLFACGACGYALLRAWPEDFPVLVRACLAVLILVGGLVFWATGNRSDDLPLAKGAKNPGWLDFMVMGLGVLALESGFLWILSVTPQPLEEIATEIESRLRPGTAAEREEENLKPGQTGNWLWNDETRRALPRRTNLKPGAKPEVFVRIVKDEDAQRLLKRQVYVRAFVLDRFEQGAWSLQGESGKELVADESGWVRMADTKEGILHEVFHGKDAGGKDVLTALQGVRAVRLPSLRLATEGMGWLPDVSGPSGFEYLASSEPLTLDDLVGKDPEMVGLREGGSGKLGELAMKAAGTGTLVERLLHIRDFLRDGYDYSLVTENTGNLDPLENFLFDEKKGHCEFFATAGALMARELGVESRVAYGWAGGQYFAENRMLVFRAREAHSWVEVNLKGYGWVVMEPTPPVVLGGGGVPSVAGAGEAMPAPDEAPEKDTTQGELLGSGHVGRIALWFTGIFAMLGGGVILVRGMKRSREMGGKKFLRGVMKDDYFTEWRNACQRKGMGGGAGRTLKRQLDGMENVPGFGQELLDYHYGVRYEKMPPDAEREKRLMKEIREWEWE